MDETTATRFRRGAATAIAAAVLALAACSSGSDQPTGTDPDHTALSEEDGDMAAVRDCMEDAGWEVELVDQPGGLQGIEGTYPDDQKEQYDQALATCQLEADVDQEQPVMTADEAEAYFDALNETAQCLQDEGFEVPPAPSRQAFIDAATRGDLSLWDVYQNFFPENPEEEVDLDAFTRAQEACPLPTAESR